jgi:hypothetical protein
LGHGGSPYIRIAYEANSFAADRETRGDIAPVRRIVAEKPA